jgi:excisionase family DNA binding protein
LDEIPKAVVVALLRASRGRHRNDHRLFSHAAQLLENDGERLSRRDDDSRGKVQNVRGDSSARFLGVSPQTVYLWVERKQIPHLRVMGRNIRFLKSDLEPFRSRFKQEVEDGTTT